MEEKENPCVTDGMLDIVSYDVLGKLPDPSVLTTADGWRVRRTGRPADGNCTKRPLSCSTALCRRRTNGSKWNRCI